MDFRIREIASRGKPLDRLTARAHSGYTKRVKLHFLGTGTSHGIPVIACDCSVCNSADSRDRRYRASVWIEGARGESVLIDCGPEFRLQALREGIRRLDAVLLTHGHADHLHGLDDLRPLTRRGSLPLYANRETLRELRERFSYAFSETQEGGGKPRFSLHEAGETFTIGSLKITPVPLLHGALRILGFLIEEDAKSIAYMSDVSEIPPSSMELLASIHPDICVLGALRKKPHATHFSFSQATTALSQIQPAQAWATHLCHEHSHREAQEQLSGGADVAWDGLVLEC